MNNTFKVKNRKLGNLVLREINNSDSEQLGKFFDRLLESTRKLYGPHPLNSEEANTICNNYPESDKTRFILAYSNQIIGYFLFDFAQYPHEFDRYSKLGISLDFDVDPVFAPCIADNYQGMGLASDVMPHLLTWAKSKKLRSIVLMGGTQEPNERARKFYNKFGFKEYSRFFTQINNVNNIDMRLTL